MDVLALEMTAQREDTTQNKPLTMAWLMEENQQLKARIAWFEQQLFGRKSEKRMADDADQLALFDASAPSNPASEEKITITYERGKGNKQRGNDCVTDTGLRFGKHVPVQVIEIMPPELSGNEADQYEVIRTEVMHRLAQRPASYIVLRYERPVLKKKDSQAMIVTPAPANVLDNSLADVSLLAGLLVDKFLYHLPLYRQHQRMRQAGIDVSRATLTNLVKRSIELLKPIADAQLDHVLQSQILTMDETPIKASRKSQGKMKTGWFWPLYGEDDEVVFTYSPTRGQQHIEATLKPHFKGTLLSDGHSAYERYAQANTDIAHAQCWAHSRRYFIKAQEQAPELAEQALHRIGQLYKVETNIREASLLGEKKRLHRLNHSQLIVDDFFEWCHDHMTHSTLTPKHPLKKAIHYVIVREHKLRVFLEDPDLPLDTNHLERALRVIPMGRKNWLFCWTELGAEHVGIIQSLIVTCKLHDINPYDFLVDVLLRINTHPAKNVATLTPRLWKKNFADHPLRSDLDRSIHDPPQ